MKKRSSQKSFTTTYYKSMKQEDKKPKKEAVEVIRSGKVRRAKLYYLRERTGKSARITEKIRKKIGVDIIQPLPKKEAVQNIEAQTDIAVEQAPKNVEKASAPKTEAQNKKK